MILVTGGTGYIGSHTVVELLNRGEKVIVADSFFNSNESVLDKIKTICNKDFIFEKVDFQNESEVIEKLKSYPIKSIIHFAAYKAVGESVDEPLKYYNNNLQSLINALTVANKLKISNFIFSSSATVYGNSDSLPVLESETTKKATNPYGATKIIGEQIIEDFAKTSPINFIILRYFNPIGAHKSGLIGDSPNGIPNNLLPYVSQVASGKRVELSVFGNDYDTKDGTCIRDYIHVVDLALGHIKALKYKNQKGNLSVFNLGTGNGVSVIEVIQAFELENNIKIPYSIVERRAGDIASLYADASKAKKELKWTASLSLKDMVRSSWNFEKNNK